MSYEYDYKHNLVRLPSPLQNSFDYLPILACLPAAERYSGFRTRANFALHHPQLLLKSRLFQSVLQKKHNGELSIPLSTGYERLRGMKD